MKAKIITANRLCDGEVVWLGAGNRWVELCGNARMLGAGEDADTLIAMAPRADVVEAYAIDVAVEQGVPVPVRFRERIRAAGPTIHAHLGKQARPDLAARAA